jgi:hypothetical protein
MSAAGVVEAVYVLEQHVGYPLTRLPRMTPDEFGLQDSEKRLGYSI